MFKSKPYFYLVLGIIAVIAVGFVGYEVGSNQGYLEGKLEGKKEIEDKYQSKIQEMFPTLDEVFSLMGSITEIQERSLILHVPAPNPFAEDSTKKVKITDSTEIAKRVAKPDEEFFKEMEDYSKAFELLEEEPERLPIAPMPYEDIGIEFSELKVGSEIEVETEENIKDKDEFFAKKIIILFTPEEE